MGLKLEDYMRSCSGMKSKCVITTSRMECLNF